jgi:hypothetical protein
MLIVQLVPVSVQGNAPSLAHTMHLDLNDDTSWTCVVDHRKTEPIFDCLRFQRCNLDFLVVIGTILLPLLPEADSVVSNNSDWASGDNRGVVPRT